METIKLKCHDCGGTMEIDASRKIMQCPYCGSKTLMLDSDEVQIEKIKADTTKSIFKSIENVGLSFSDNTRKKIQYKQDKLEASKNKDDDMKWITIAIIACFIFMFLADFL